MLGTTATLVGRRRLVTVQINLLVVVLLLFLVPVEANLRVVEISGSELVEEDATLRVLDERTHHALVPMVEVRSRWGDRITTVRTNSLGLCDRERRLREARQREATIGWLVRPRILELLVGATTSSSVEEEPEYRTDPRFLWTERNELAAREWVEQGLEISSNFIVRIATLCRREVIDLTLVIDPHPTQLKGRAPSRFQRLTGDLAAEHGIRLIDLFPAFRSLDDWYDYFIPGDIHWNDRGNDLMAELLASELQCESSL